MKRALKKHTLPHVATRVFGTPLLIQPEKLDVIMSVLGPRIGLPASESDPKADYGDDRMERKPYEVVGGCLAVINVYGSLVNKATGMEAWSGLSSYDQIKSEFADAIADPAIKGVLLRCDSPGGECSGAFDLADHIRANRGAKPIWAAVDDMAFSAAYLIASQADRIFITQTGGAGSIGVIAKHVDQSEYDASIGVKYTTLLAGARKNDMNPHEPLSDEARASLQAEIDRLYGMFVASVAKGRKMKVGDVRSTEAALYFGSNAIAAGLADVLGTYDDAIAALMETVTPKSPSAARASAATSSDSASAEPISPSKEISMNNEKLTADAAETRGAVINAGSPEDMPDKGKKNCGDDEEDMKKDGKNAAQQPADASEIMALCELSGVATLADARKFIGAKMTRDQVTNELLSLRKQAEPAVNGAVAGGARTSVANKWSAMVDLNAVKENFSLAKDYAAKLNPSLYEAYLDANPAQCMGR